VERRLVWEDEDASGSILPTRPVPGAET
jgi:hypothetical protein